MIHRKPFLFPLLLLLFAALVFTGLWLTDYLFAVREFEWSRYVCRNAPLLLSLIPLWIFTVRFLLPGKRKITGNLLTAAAAFLSSLLLAEVAFSFVAISTGGGYSLVSKNWFAKNWRENKLGFRDDEPENKDRADVPNLFLIGDSYIAGHGLTDTAQRFSNLLSNTLAPCYDVFNVAKCGAGTKDEFDFLQQYPVKPHVIVLAHVPNDISEVVDKKQLNKQLREKGGFASIKLLKYRIGFLYKHSFLYNFYSLVMEEQNKEAYYNYVMGKYGSPEKFLQSNEGLLMTDMAYYTNDSLLHLHLQNLQLFIRYASEQKIKLVVVLFPRTNDKLLLLSDKLANHPIAQFFKAQQIPVLNLTAALSSISEKQRQVSPYDPHTSAIANQKIADELLHFLLEQGISQKGCAVGTQ
jgi:hypothetical protein